MNTSALGELTTTLSEGGAKSVHIALVVRCWLTGRPLESLRTAREHPLPRGVLERLPAIEATLDLLAVPIEEHSGADGSTRRVLRLGDGRTIESVDLLRDGLCV